MSERPEWLHCVTKSPGLTWCERESERWEWCFMDSEHARLCLAKNDRLVPCPDCMGAIGEHFSTKAIEIRKILQEEQP